MCGVRRGCPGDAECRKHLSGNDLRVSSGNSQVVWEGHYRTRMPYDRTEPDTKGTRSATIGHEMDTDAT